MKSIEILNENSDRVYLPVKLYWVKQIKSQLNNLLSRGPYLQNSCLSRFFFFFGVVLRFSGASC